MREENLFKKFEREGEVLYGRNIFTRKQPRSRVLKEIKQELEKVLDKYPTDPGNVLVDFVELHKSDYGYYLLCRDSDWHQQSGDLPEKLEPEMVQNWWRQLVKTLNYLRAPELGWSFITLDQLRFSGSLSDSEKPDVRLLPPELSEILIKYGDAEELLATEYFRPPELIEDGGSAGEKSLVFSLGVIIYYFLTGNPPFQGRDKSEIVDRIITDSRLKLRDLRPEIAPALGELVDSCLASRPEDRPGMAELQEKLRVIAGHRLKLSPKDYQRERGEIQRRIKFFNLKQTLKLNVKRRWHLLLLFAVIIIMIPLMFLSTGVEEQITSSHSAEEVALYFYQSINEKNLTLLNDTAVVDLGRLRRMVSESYVRETVRQFYEMQIPEEEAGEEHLADESLGEEFETLFGVEDLDLISEQENEEEKIFRADYQFFINTEEGRVELEARDYLRLNIVNDRWQITGVSGFIKDIITGDFEEPGNGG